MQHVKLVRDDETQKIFLIDYISNHVLTLDTFDDWVIVDEGKELIKENLKSTLTEYMFDLKDFETRDKKKEKLFCLNLLNMHDSNKSLQLITDGFNVARILK